MTVLENQSFEEERALYGSKGLEIRNCRFDGPADGESALKESADITVRHCFMNLRYPFWHDENLCIEDSELTPLCRAALWYSHHLQISRTKLHGIKAVRECKDITINSCDIDSPEFGWSADGIKMEDSTAQSEYFLLRARNVVFDNVDFHGKYSFQYVEHALFTSCRFDTKDAFWHAKDITVRNSVIKGEYLAWYSDGLTLEHCTIIGTQPFCYCKNLKLIDCKMIDTDLCFEKSDVDAVITTPVLSIKNPHTGRIQVPEAGEIIRDDPEARGQIVVGAPQEFCHNHTDNKEETQHA